MITQSEAAAIKSHHGRPVWHGEDFADAVVRMNREIRAASSNGCDGASIPFNTARVNALLSILKEHGFDGAMINRADSSRIDISW